MVDGTITIMNDLDPGPGPPHKWPMHLVTSARLGVNGPHRWLQIKTDTKDRWLDVVPTKPLIAAQAFVSLEDEDDGWNYNLLSDPNNEDSDGIEVEGVLYCPQAAMLILELDAGRFTGTAGTPVAVPEVAEAEAFLKAFRAKQSFV